MEVIIKALKSILNGIKSEIAKMQTIVDEAQAILNSTKEEVSKVKPYLFDIFAFNLSGSEEKKRMFSELTEAVNNRRFVYAKHAMTIDQSWENVTLSLSLNRSSELMFTAVIINNNIIYLITAKATETTCLVRTTKIAKATE